MKIAVLGAGAAGTAITRFLNQEKNVTSIRVLDRNGNALEELEESVHSSKLRVHRVAIDKEMSVSGLLTGVECIISALPFKHNYRAATIALKAGIPYVDLGGDDNTTIKQLALAEKAKEANTIMIPNAGFAPGLVNILAMHGFESFEKVDSIIIRAAGLPKNPVPPLNYHLSFSPVGLVNEYLNKASIIENGKSIEIDALDGYETCKLKARPELGTLEAFYTSGSSTFIVRELEGKVNTFDYKTLRYVGHRDIIKAIFELGFNSPQIIDIRSGITYKDLFIRQLKKNLPYTKEDIAVAKINVTGSRSGQKFVREYEVYLESEANPDISAMMTVTSQSAVTTAMMIAEKKITAPGGVYIPENILPREEYIERMKSHGVNITISETEAS